MSYSGYPARLPVDDEFQDPQIPCDSYYCQLFGHVEYSYTSRTVLDEPEWADCSDVTYPQIWSRLTYYRSDNCETKSIEMLSLQDAGVKSETEVYDKILPLHMLSSSHKPINPFKRTGLLGRGVLGKFGPNHAADPIVVRYNNPYQCADELFDLSTCCKHLEFVGIQRADTLQWAIPGGMVDANEDVSKTLLREFKEEAANESESTLLDSIFKNPQNQRLVYAGYVDDPRNTDNAWIETTAKLFFSVDNCAKDLRLKEDQQETVAAKWIKFSDLTDIDVFANHKDLLLKAFDMCMQMCCEYNLENRQQMIGRKRVRQ